MPPRSTTLDWLFPLLGGLIAMAGLVLLLWALFRDRSRRRRRCPKCWYEMEGTPGLTCPECGHAAKSEQRLFKRRRRWKWAMLAVIVLLAGALVGEFPALRLGWERAIPTAILVHLAPAEDPPSSGAFSSPQVQALMAQNPAIAQRITVIKAPPSVGQRLTTEVWRRVDGGRMTGWAARAFFNRYIRRQKINLARSVYVPDRWPLDQPLLAHVDPALVYNTGRFETCARLRGGTAWVSHASRWGFLDPVHDPTMAVELEVEIRSSRIVLYRGVVDVPVTIQGDVSTFLERESGPARDEQVKAALAPTLIRQPDGSTILRYRDRSTQAPWPAIDYGIVFTAELRRGDTMVARGQGLCEWSRPVWKNWEEIPLTPVGPDLPAEGLTLTITGDPRAAGLEYVTRRYGDRGACWVGSFDIPVNQ